MVVMMLVLRVTPGHVVGGERRQVSAGAVCAVRVVGMVSRRVVAGGGRHEVVALDLVGGLGQHRDVDLSTLRIGR